VLEVLEVKEELLERVEAHKVLEVLEVLEETLVEVLEQETQGLLVAQVNQDKLLFTSSKGRK